MSAMRTLVQRGRSRARPLTAYRLDGPVIHNSSRDFPLGTFKIVPKDPVDLVVELVVVRLPTTGRASSGIRQLSK